MHVTQQRTPVPIIQQASSMSPHFMGDPGHLLSPSQRQCWGWHPQESRLRPESSQVLHPPHILSDSRIPPLEFSEEVRRHGLV